MNLGSAMRRAAGALLVAVLAGLVLPACAAPARAGQAVVLRTVRSVEGISEYALPNGLQVLLVPDDSKPTTTVNLTYRVGSRHENYGETGMAHLLEHLMFKGTPTTRNVLAEFQKRGMAGNGTTSFDRTNYTAQFSADADNLDWYLGWLADSMVNSFIARKDLDTEMTVVRNEMESGENSPDRILFQRALALMFDWHNYGKDTIGARSDVENVDIPRLQAFYRQYYQPDNATLIVSGKFDTARVLARVGTVFGKLPRPKRVLPVHYTLDPAQDGDRAVTLRRTGGTPILMVGYHTPPGGALDFAAAELLALALGDAPSGRLHKRLTERQLASGTFGFAYGLGEPAVLFLGAQLAPGQPVDAAREVLLSTIESLAAEPLQADELERARAKWLKGWEQAFTNPESIGLSLSESIAQGDWRMFFLTRDRVRDITLAEVQRFATAYLLRDNRTLATYLPTDAPQRAPAPARVDIAQVLQAFKPQEAAAAVEAFEATPANIDARTRRFEVAGFKAAVLPKGTRGQAVRGQFVLRYGDEKSLFGQSDAAAFAAGLLDKGTKELNREQLQDRLDQLRAELAVSAAPGELRIAFNTRRDHLAGTIALIGQMLRNPALPADAFDELRRQALTGIEQQRKEPDALADNALDRHANPYPRGDVRYARSFDEAVDDLNALTLEGVRAFHARFLAGARGEFAAVGDLDADQARAALLAAFGQAGPVVPYARVPNPLRPPQPVRLQLATPDKQNATLLARLPLPLDDNSADYPALAMANYLLGGGGSSRLWRRVREKEGLSYDVRSTIAWNSREQHSTWTASAIFAPQNRAKVEAAIAEEIARALRDGFTAAELAEGQRGLLNLRRLSRAQDSRIADSLANNLDLGRTFAFAAGADAALAKLTLAQVNAALRKYIVPENFASVLAGDFKP